MAVETALVLILMTSLVFGVFEFSRLLMDWNLLNNAAREGCRYAIANNTSATISTDVQTIVATFMAGQSTSFSNFTVTVSGTHQGVTTPVNNLTAGDLVTVSVSGTYKFLNIIPFVKMPTSFSISSSVIMGCEGGV
ncbi:MAG: TadE/TadG family type IV pilus assembly protein [Isosphaerales bacterium]